MLLNETRRFLFIHIHKTAGTSITRALQAIPGTRTIFHPHSLMKHVALTEEQNTLFKFAFVRNPWDRLLSWYNMIRNKGPTNRFMSYVLENSRSFSEFLDCVDEIAETDDPTDSAIPYWKSIAYNQLDYISTPDGRLNIDFVGRFETLNHDFAAVCKRLDLGAITLEHTNRYEHAPYRSYYTDCDIEKVRRLYARDIRHFGYEF